MKEKIRRAIMANFAVYSENMKCDGQLEESVDAAKAFYEKMTRGGDQYLIELAEKLMTLKRYKRKMELIKTHIALCN